MTTKKKSFILHHDSLGILEKLNDEQAGKLFKAISLYCSKGEIDCDMQTELLLFPFQSQFDRDNESYQKVVDRNKNNGLKGGRPKKQDEAKKPTGLSGISEDPKKADSVSGSVNGSDSVKEVIKDLLSSKPDSILVLQYLNDSLGTKYKATTKAHIANINARIEEGHSVDDLKAVVNSKKIEWGNDPAMAQYLRPQTLFGNKFQGYLVSAKTPPKKMPAKSVHSFEDQKYKSGAF